VLLGLAACGVAAMRRRSGVRVLLWWGIWSTMYGVHPLLDSMDTLGLLPHWLHVTVPYVGTATGYLVLVVAWLELETSLRSSRTSMMYANSLAKGRRVA